MEKLKKRFHRWMTVAVILLLANLILTITLLLVHAQAAAGPIEGTHRSIQKLYVLTEGLGNLEPVMEVMTVHGSIRYYADETDWLYFEQMAGSLSITLGTDVHNADYRTYEENGIQYRCVTEKLGSELIWEDEDGYMFYLYSSLDMERLMDISRGLVLRAEGAVR